MIRNVFIACAAAAALFYASVPAWAQTPPAKRHLVYNFTYGTEGDLQVHESNGYASDTRSGAGNTRDYSGTIKDKGTITVDIIKEQPDKGLVVMISEQGEQTRRADPAECAVYGNTNIFCDPNKTVNSEEYTLLRFLGTTFVDPNQLDAKQHWKIDQSNTNVSTVADYTITSNNNGVMTIDESRVIKQTGAGAQTTDVTTKIGYDFARLVPTKVDEYVVSRGNQGGSTMTTTVQTTLVLQSDSMAKN